MIEQAFITLTNAITGSVWVALLAALGWGVLSILLSPCHLSSIPLIVGFISEQKTSNTRSAFYLSLTFASGILITIAIIGVITAAMGKMMGDLGKFGNYAAALVFLVVGLHLIGLIPMPFNGPGQISFKKRGLFAALILGLVFGLALGPCTFAFMAPVLSVVLSVASTKPIFAASLLLFYGIGHCAVIVIAGTSTEMVEKYLHWNDKSKGTTILKKICGVLVIIGGIYLVYTAR